ncbi:MAG: hypothetical protein CVV46_02925 [Spirochaetae bacterium HGW-Spirochaetae-2]|jgi:hypothetical protein|nr:MAG: hypothetical protein CVV46_02925 [Spirochaetae bacterium HGW-Spirochaetae-2]
MKGLFLVYSKIDYKNPTGIEKKIISQIKVFNKSGIECEPYVLGNRNLSILQRVLFILPYTRGRICWKYESIFKDIDFIYFRRGATFCQEMRNFFKEIKQRNPNIKIILEIPSYPYDKEINSIGTKALLFKEKFNRKHLKGLIDCIAVASHINYDRIWGVRALSFINGIDIGAIKPRNINIKSSCLNLLCIGIFSPWHGYERIIYGLKEYYCSDQQHEVILHFVGDGPEKFRYEDLARKFNLTDYVVFHGKLNHRALDEIYNYCDVAIASLGMYKLDINVQNSLKTREYLAKGMPIVTGCPIDYTLLHNLKYIYEVSNDDSPINISGIVDFFINIKSQKSIYEISDEIREYAKKYADIELSFKPVIEYLKESDEYIH